MFAFSCPDAKNCLIKYELFVRNKTNNTDNTVEDIFLLVRVITSHYMLQKETLNRHLHWELSAIGSKHSTHRTRHFKSTQFSGKVCI